MAAKFDDRAQRAADNQGQLYIYYIHQISAANVVNIHSALEVYTEEH